MPHNLSSRIWPVLLSSFLATTVLAGVAFAEKHPREYPEQGKIVGVGTNGRTVPAGNTSRTVFTHVYKVETDTKMFQLDCGKTPLFFSTGGECGGDKKLQIGDVLHFRVKNQWAYIPIMQTETDSTTGVKQTVPGEEKLRILSEDLKTDAKPAEAAPDGATK
jgi:hypothetical protein